MFVTIEQTRWIQAWNDNKFEPDVLQCFARSIAESADRQRKLTTLAKINLAELAGVAMQILGDLRIDGGQFQFTVMHFRHQRLDIGASGNSIGVAQKLLGIFRE